MMAVIMENQKAKILTLAEFVPTKSIIGDHRAAFASVIKLKPHSSIYSNKALLWVSSVNRTLQRVVTTPYSLVSAQSAIVPAYLATIASMSWCNPWERNLTVPLLGSTSTEQYMTAASGRGSVLMAKITAARTVHSVSPVKAYLYGHPWNPTKTRRGSQCLVIMTDLYNIFNKAVRTSTSDVTAVTRIFLNLSVAKYRTQSRLLACSWPRSVPKFFTA